MQTTSFTSLSLEDVALIVKGRYRPGQYAVIQSRLEHFKRIATSLEELFEHINGFLNQSMMATSQIDPVHQALIDKRSNIGQE